MIGFIEGVLQHKEEGRILLQVSGIGFDIRVSNQTLYSLPVVGDVCKVFTYLQVKEDDLCLYGFSMIEEKNMFIKLIEVSGIGPRAGISILSCVKLSDLIVAILKKDVATLSKIKGIGKKTAEKICIELADKISPLGFEINKEEIEIDSPAVEEAIDALMSLGLLRTESTNLAKKNSKGRQSVEDIVAACLRGM